MIKIAKAKDIKNAKFIIADILNFKSKKLFNGIIAYDVLFHLKLEFQAIIYEKLAKLLKDDGLLIFTHGTKLGEIRSKMFEEEFYYSAFDLKELNKALTINGFEIIDLVLNYENENEQRDLIIIAKKVNRK